jgi:integrase
MITRHRVERNGQKMTVKLSKRAIDALPATAKSGGEHHNIEGLPGLSVVIYPSGRKTFFLRIGGRSNRKRVRVGEYGALTPAQIKTRVDQLRGQYAAEDKTPAQIQKESKPAPAESTFGAWVAVYLVDVVARKKHPRHDELYLGQACKVWGSKGLSEITAGMIAKEVAKRVRSGAKTTGNRFLASVRACLQAAWRLDMIPSNPAMKVKAMPEPDPRTRTLTDKEFAKLIDAIAATKDQYHKTAFILLLWTGARMSEVLNARWGDIDLEAASWRIASTKSGKPQTIPLLPEVVASVRETPRTDSPFVVASPKSTVAPRYDLKRAWVKLLDAAEVEGVHIHDLRRTFGLHVAKASGLHVASKLLRHSDIRVTERHYAPLGLDDLRGSLEQLVAHRNAKKK